VLSAREMLRPWTLPNEGTGEFCNTLLPFYIFGPGNQNIHFGDAAPFFLLGLLGYLWVDLFLSFWFYRAYIFKSFVSTPINWYIFFILVVFPWHRCGSTWNFSEFWLDNTTFHRPKHCTCEYAFARLLLSEINCAILRRDLEGGFVWLAENSEGWK